MTDANIAHFRINPDAESDPDSTFTKDGADRLAAMISEYWAKRGHDVQLRVFPCGFHPAIRAARYDIRSDMIGGFPRAMVRPVIEQEAA